ncbi:MAG: hypothetical protein ACI4WT_04080 [Oligosphaeraceae bacterium]
MLTLDFGHGDTETRAVRLKQLQPATGVFVALCHSLFGMLHGKIKRKSQAFLGIHGENLQVLIVAVLAVGHLLGLKPQNEHIARVGEMLHKGAQRHIVNLLQGDIYTQICPICETTVAVATVPHLDLWKHLGNGGGGPKEQLALLHRQPSVLE